MTNILAGFRVHENPSTITYDEYLEVFKRDSQMAPIGEVMRIERVSGPPVASYAERLRQRREAVLQRTAGASGFVGGFLMGQVSNLPSRAHPARVFDNDRDNDRDDDEDQRSGQ